MFRALPSAVSVRHVHYRLVQNSQQMPRSVADAQMFSDIHH
jgi:hypothetical protein